jgi:Kae1-associated kinase Bud32
MIFNQKEIMAKGAEAIVSRGIFLEAPVIVKHRAPKTYRLSQIDQTIRLQRLRGEARTMTLAWKLGVRVPALLGIDQKNRTLIIEELQGATLFSLMNLTSLNILQQIFQDLGRQVGLLHKNDIIHGDLTVFNVIILKENNPWLIDFGLGQISVEIEKKADDLLTFHSTLKAIHTEYQQLFREFKSGYSKTYELNKKIFEQMKKIQSRARYIAREERLE